MSDSPIVFEKDNVITMWWILRKIDFHPVGYIEPYMGEWHIKGHPELTNTKKDSFDAAVAFALQFFGKEGQS
ncbi:hypothetical protein [Rufibacter soli]